MSAPLSQTPMALAAALCGLREVERNAPRTCLCDRCSDAVKRGVPLPHRPGVFVPWQVRYARWWQLRQAHYEWFCGRSSADVARTFQYANAAVKHWLRTGDLSHPGAYRIVRCLHRGTRIESSEDLALERMRSSPALAALDIDALHGRRHGTNAAWCRCRVLAWDCHEVRRREATMTSPASYAPVIARWTGGAP